MDEDWISYDVVYELVDYIDNYQHFFFCYYVVGFFLQILGDVIDSILFITFLLSKHWSYRKKKEFMCIWKGKV